MLSQDNLYWSDWEARSILQVDKQLRASENGSYGVTNAVIHLSSPMDVQVYHELKQPPAESEFGMVLFRISFQFHFFVLCLTSKKIPIPPSLYIFRC